jgi:alpha-tubulin suppressor-like RCC1 family protein
VRALFAIAIAVFAGACDRREPYSCASSEQCVQGAAHGMCEPSGFCSFADPSCEGGRRYEASAGDGLGGSCIEVELAPPPPPEVCGAVAQTCCKTGLACTANGRCDGGTCGRCVTEVALGRHAACLLKYDGTVWCAGENGAGQLGFGIAGAPVPTWTQARDSTSAAIGDATAVTAGSEHACAVRAGGTVWCWGQGFGTSAVQVLKIDDTPLADIVEIGAGYSHRCGRDRTGGVWCWGSSNSSGQLGDGTTIAHPKAAPVLDAPAGPPLAGAISLSVGGSHNCVRKAGDEVWCWGRNGGGELGDTMQVNRPSPVKVASASSVAAGQRHTCAVHLDGTVWCSGQAWRNRIGNGVAYDNDAPPYSYPTPVQVVKKRGGAPLVNATQVAAGGVSCALVDKAVYCWGDNLYGQIGAGLGSTTPALVLTTDGRPLTGIERIVAHGPHACAHRDDGEVLCWGRGLDGLFGDGAFANRGVARPLGFSCQ